MIMTRVSKWCCISRKPLGCFNKQSICLPVGLFLLSNGRESVSLPRAHGLVSGAVSRVSLWGVFKSYQSVCLSVCFSCRMVETVCHCRVPACPCACACLECVMKSCACARSPRAKRLFFGRASFFCLPVFVCASIYQDDVLLRVPPRRLFCMLEGIYNEKEKENRRKRRHLMNEDDKKEKKHKRRRESKTRLQQEQELKSRLAAGLPPLGRWGGGQGRKEG